MSRTRWALGALAIALVLTVAGAAASCERCGLPIATLGYYPYSPTFCCPPSIRPIAYACPMPAPPSNGPTTFGTPEPPPAGKQPLGPTFKQYRTFGGVPQAVEPRTQMCKVSFWNLTGDDVTLFIGSEPKSVQKDRALVIELNRQFTWRTDKLNPKLEDVPDDLNHFEVLIRQ